MILQYGPATLNLLHVKQYIREAVYDDANYLWTKVNLVVQAVYNPATQGDATEEATRFAEDNTLPVPYVPAPLNGGFVFTGPTEFTSPGGPGRNTRVPAVEADNALRHHLMQPRQRLILSIGGIRNLVSPLPGYFTDAANGPLPLFCNVTEIQGTRTWVVEYGIETCLNECPIINNGAWVMLSHVYSTTQELDEDFWTRQTIKGRVVFRSDVQLVDAAPDPDAFRSVVIPPPPPTFKRESVRVWPSKGSTLYEYEVVDRQMPLGWDAAGVTRIAASHTVSTDEPVQEAVATRDLLQLLDKVAAGLSLTLAGESHGAGGAKGAAATAKRGIASRIGGALPAIGAGALAAISTGFRIGLDRLPTNTHTVVVEVWGDSSSRRYNLEAFAWDIAGERLSGLLRVIANIQGRNGNVLDNLIKGLPPAMQDAARQMLAFIRAGQKIGAIGAVGDNAANLLAAIGLMLPGGRKSVTHDVTGKHIRIEYTIITGPLLSLQSPFVAAVLPINAAVNTTFPLTDDTATIITVDGLIPGPVTDNNARGNCLALALASIPKVPCGPANPPQAYLFNPSEVVPPNPTRLEDGSLPAAGQPVPDPIPIIPPLPFFPQ